MSFGNECVKERVDDPDHGFDLMHKPDQIINDISQLTRNKNLIVNIENSTRTRSVARKHFGVLKDSDKNVVIDRFHVYCKICFMHPDERKIYRYKNTGVSTGNLLAHLIEEHNIKSDLLNM